jgi:hypothetical protein
VFAISGLALLAGVSIQVAYQLWLPVAIVAPFAGYRAIVWRTLPVGRARPAALALALMGASPLIPVFEYGGITNRDQNSQMITWATHLPAYWQAWGYFPVALALALMPIYVLGIRDALIGSDRRVAGPASTRLAFTGIAVALLSPQAGLVLAILTAIFLAPRSRALAPGLTGLLAPLASYLVLSLVSPD